MRCHAVNCKEEEMTEIAVRLYGYFKRHRVLFYSLLAVSVILMGFSLANLRFDENITSFLPQDADSGNMAEVFDNLKVSDKFVFMLDCKDGVPDHHVLAKAADTLAHRILSRDEDHLVRDFLCRVDGDAMEAASEFVLSHLPVFLEDQDFRRLDSLTDAGYVRKVMEGNRAVLLSPAGSFVKDYVMRDPLGIATPVLSSLSDLDPDSGYVFEDGRIYSPDGCTLMCFLTPEFGTGNTGSNDRLVSIVEEELDGIRSDFPEVEAEYFAGPAVGVYNARQIKKDTLMTSLFAIILVAAVIMLSFRKRGTIPMVFLPVIYGMLFSLAVIAIIKGSISSIAVGTGAVVLGIALSYSIHVIAHQMHVRSVEQLVRELVFPLTVGSLTTIGAFAGLLFTSSPLLRDFGLFASLTLVGTTLFTLVFLPHFLVPMSGQTDTPALKAIERINGYGYDRNRWIIIFLAVLAVTSIFTSRSAGFDADMMNLSYMPEHLRVAEERLEAMSGDGGAEEILFVSTGRDLSEASCAYSGTLAKLDSLGKAGLTGHFTSAGRFIVPYEVQRERIGRWNSWWTPERREQVKKNMESASAKAGFKAGAFSRLDEMLDRDYAIIDYASEENMLLDNVTAFADSLVMLVSTVSLLPEDKEEVYSCFDGSGTVIFDRSWFAGSAVLSMSDDLDKILFISSMIVFFGLWLSYRRLELAVMSFIPMLVTWFLIIGMMGLFGIRFNIVNMVICTFIFGIGDDFSIFITDGLTKRYSTGKDMLSSHKTAIFFSAFTIVAGMGAMVAARHPALHSVGVISLVGMLAVLLIAYTLQPLVFRLAVAGPVSRGRHPYTIGGTLLSMVLWAEFVTACILVCAAVVLMLPVPMSRLKKQKAIRYLACHAARCIIRIAPICNVSYSNPRNEDFSTPAILVSNHQSYLDIVWVLALSPKLLILAKGWVRKVPVFYPIARFLGFYYSDDGFESITESFGKRLGEGWSLAVFPEGTREMDGKIHRFHRGAFYMAEELGLDIVPVVMYGNGRVLPKHAPFNISDGISSVEILPRIRHRGVGYKSLAKEVQEVVKKRYEETEVRFRTVTDNRYYVWAVRRSMAYKGPAAEKETRLLLKDSAALASLDSSVPASGKILHLGCGRGQLDFLLKMLAPGRQITAVDIDKENIDMARHNYLCCPGIEFICSDPDSFSTDGYDAVIIGNGQSCSVRHECHVEIK